MKYAWMPAALGGANPTLIEIRDDWDAMPECDCDVRENRGRCHQRLGRICKLYTKPEETAVDRDAIARKVVGEYQSLHYSSETSVRHMMDALEAAGLYDACEKAAKYDAMLAMDAQMEAECALTQEEIDAPPSEAVKKAWAHFQVLRGKPEPSALVQEARDAARFWLAEALKAEAERDAIRGAAQALLSRSDVWRQVSALPGEYDDLKDALGPHAQAEPPQANPQQAVPVCPKCGNLALSVPRMGISHVCEPPRAEERI